MEGSLLAEHKMHLAVSLASGRIRLEWTPPDCSLKPDQHSWPSA